MNLTKATLSLILSVGILSNNNVYAFTPSSSTIQQRTLTTTTNTNNNNVVLYAGGFEWDDPTESFDQGVDNPFKKDGASGNDVEESIEDMKIDPARLLGPRLQGSNLYFIGMMGCGKSAVGDVVARRMGTYNFLDTDDIIEKATQSTIPEIFESEGEETFRTIEAQVLDSVHAYVRCVISTGGGIVCRTQNWSKLQTGIVVWLDVDPAVIMKRIEGNTDRPLLQTENPEQTLRDLLKEREELYKQGDIRIVIDEDKADLDTEKVADLVVRELHDFIDENPPAWKKAKAKAQSEGLDWVQ